MMRTDIGKHKYLGLLTGLNITFMLVCNFTAARIIAVFGVGVSVTLLYFPLTYLIADVLTEVYGLSQARSIIWLMVYRVGEGFWRHGSLLRGFGLSSVLAVAGRLCPLHASLWLWRPESLRCTGAICPLLF
jgi:hypothetical protein